MTSFLKLIGWLMFVGVFAFIFLVLLDYGPERFAYGFQKESERIIRAIKNRL